MPPRRGKKLAVQKQEEAKLRPASAVSAEIVQLNRQLTVIQLLDQGYDDRAIAEHLKISTQGLQQIKDRILATLTPAYLDAVENFRARAYGRYERLYRIAEAMATGVVPPGGPYIGQVENMPQKDWVKLALQILGAEAELFKSDLELHAKRQAEGDENDLLNFTETRTLTFSRNNPLAQLASQHIKENWGQDQVLDYIYQDGLPPNPPQDSEQDKLDNLDPSDLIAQVTQLQERIAKVSRHEADPE